MTLVRVCVLLAGVLALAAAAGNETMAPLSQYLMSPQAEIALARSAAPAAISKHATILVLGAHGYAVAAEGPERLHLHRRAGLDAAVRRSKLLER